MSFESNISIPATLAILSMLALFSTISIYFDVKAKKSVTAKRKSILLDFEKGITYPASRAREQFATTKIVIDSYAGKIVNENYGRQLRKMLVVSGDWESKNFASLVRRKIAFAFVGFLLIFALLLLDNPGSLPIVVSIVFVAYILPDIDRAFRRIFGKKYRSKLERLLDRSGNWEAVDYFQLIRRKVLFATAGFVLGYFYLLAQAKTPGTFLASVASVAIGFFLPDLLLQNRVLKRKEEIADTLPEAVDMLQMCVGAGLAFPAALTRVAESQSGPVSEEFSRVTTEVQLGKSRSEALQGMAERTQERNVQKFVNAMQQVTTFGIPVLNVLMEQSKEMRAIRREKARERAQKVPIKILAPIMLCFLPAVIVIVLGPAVVSLVTNSG